MAKPKKKAKKRTATRQPPVSSPENEGEDFEKLKQWLDRQEQWEKGAASAPYDGVLGTLPDWIPHGIRNDFVRLRNNLLSESVGGERITHAIALMWIDRHVKLGETNENTYIPQEVFEIVGLLARWRYVVGLGPQRGLKELGVPTAKFQGRKRGAFQRETIYIARLRKRYPHEPADDLYRTLRSIAESHLNRHNPTPGQCPFNWNAVKREILKGDRPYRLSTFRNTLTDIDRRLAKGEFADL